MYYSDRKATSAPSVCRQWHNTFIYFILKLKINGIDIFELF